MKQLFSIIFLSFSLAGISQTHQVGLSGGINTLRSWDGEAPLGKNSPFDSKIGYSINLAYQYVFINNVTLSLKNSFTSLNFQSNDAIAFRDVNNEPVRADFNLQQQYYHVSLGGGYLFQINDSYSIATVVGMSMLFYYKQTAQSEGYPETREERKREWESEYRYYGVFLSFDQKYLIYDSRKYSFYLTSSIRATQVVNYLDLDANINRVLPEFTLGVAMAFGKSSGSRF